MEPNLNQFLGPQAMYNGVNQNASRFGSTAHLSAREGQASQADILLAINRMMGLAPASNRATGTAYVQPVIPSIQGAKEATEIYNQSGAAQATSQAQQMALVQALMQKLGIF